MQPPAAGDVPQDVHNAHVELVAHSNGLGQLLGQIKLEVSHLVHQGVLEAPAVGLREFVKILLEERPLLLPVTAVRCCYSGFTFLEESPGKIARPSRELWALEGLLDDLIAVEDDDGGAPDEDREDVPVLLRELVEGLAEVPDVEVGQGAEEREAGWTWRKVSRSQRSLDRKMK